MESHNQVILYPPGTYQDASWTQERRKGLELQQLDGTPANSNSNSSIGKEEGYRVLQVWDWMHKRSRDDDQNSNVGGGAGDDRHRWYFLIDGANVVEHMRSSNPHPWEKLHLRIAALSK